MSVVDFGENWLYVFTKINHRHAVSVVDFGEHIQPVFTRFQVVGEGAIHALISMQPL